MATATKKPQKRKPKPKVTPEAKVEVFDHVAKLEDERRVAMAEVEEARQALKAKKEILGGITSDLHRAVWEAAHPEIFPLYQAESNGKAQELAPGDDSWKAIKLTEALPDLSAAILAKLHEASIDTMGELQQWTADGKKRITDIKGIGAGAAEKIEEACTAFWASRKPASDPKPETNGKAK